MPQKKLELVVSPDFVDMRLDALLARINELPGRNGCVKLIEQGKVTINGQVVNSKKEKLALDDRVAVIFESQEIQDTPFSLVPTQIPLNVVYEDDHLIVISKQAGLVCHPSPGHMSDTLCNALVARYGYENLGTLQGDDRPGIVHRLDMDTTGLMLAAHSDAVQEDLQDLIRTKRLTRRYIALVQGYVAADEGTVDAAITRSKKNRLMMAVSDSDAARPSLTTFKTLARFGAGNKDNGYSLLECSLFTGRTHQIRVHMRHIGHACVGDPLYGKQIAARDKGLTRQFLHSWYVQFEHPVTGENVEIIDTLPEDLVEVVTSMKNDVISITTYGEKILDRLNLDLTN